MRKKSLLTGIKKTIKGISIFATSMLALLIVFKCTGYIRTLVSHEPLTEIQILEQQREDYKKKQKSVERSFSALMKKNNKHLESLQQECTLAYNAYDAISIDIPIFIEDLTGIDDCFGYIKNTVCDTLKIDNIENRVETSLNNVINPRFTDPCVAIAKDLEKAFLEFEHKITKESLDFQIETAKIIPQQNISMQNDSIIDTDLVQEKLKDILSTKNWAMFGLTFEALTIKSTINLIKTLFAKGIKKVTASATTAGTLAIADGPAPFADVAGGLIFAGGLILTGVEIYQAQIALPKELEETLQNIIIEQKELVLQPSLELLENYYNQVLIETESIYYNTQEEIENILSYIDTEIQTKDNK